MQQRWTRLRYFAQLGGRAAAFLVSGTGWVLDALFTVAALVLAFSPDLGLKIEALPTGPWAPVVPVLGLALVALFESAYRLDSETSNDAQSAREQRESLSDGARYTVIFESLDADTEWDANGAGTVTLKMTFRNAGTRMLHFRVADINIVVGNQTMTNPPLTNDGGYIGPEQTRLFNLPTFVQAPLLPGPVDGHLDFSVLYGLPDVGYQYRLLRKLTFTISPPAAGHVHIQATPTYEADERLGTTIPVLV